MGLSRKNSFILYTSILLLAIAAVAVSPDIANGALCGLLLLCIFVATIYYLIQRPQPIKATGPLSHTPKYTDPTSNDLIEKPVEDNASINMEPLMPLNTKKRTRLNYLDNLKSLLTSIVVIHHITCSFCGNGWSYMIGSYYNPFLILSGSLTSIDQSYFMCLFFFISGYFTPISFKKKGRQRFLYDKFYRLGIPFLFYFFVLGPIHNLLINKVFIKNGNTKSASWYQPDPGPCWFLGWLLLFNVCYCIMDQQISYYEKKLPSTMKLILYGLVFGFIQLIVIILLSNGSFIFMPISVGSLPFDILFFISGTLAKRNGWLKTITASYLYVVLTFLCSLGMIGITIYFYMADMGIGMPKKHASIDCDSDNDDSIEFTGAVLVIAVGIFVFYGIGCIVFSLGMIQFASLKMNVRNKFTKFFSDAAYTVYIIHPLVITPATWTFSQILYHFNDVKFVFCDGDNFSKTHFGNNYLVFIGWFYTVCVSLIIVWPISWAIKQIPGINKMV